MGKDAGAAGGQGAKPPLGGGGALGPAAGLSKAWGPHLPPCGAEAGSPYEAGQGRLLSTPSAHGHHGSTRGSRGGNTGLSLGTAELMPSHRLKRKSTGLPKALQLEDQGQ